MRQDQESKIHALLKEGHDFETVLDHAEELTGRPIVSLTDLDSEEASYLIDRLRGE